MTAPRTRQLSVDELALKRRFRELVRALGGQVDAASHCRVGQSQLSDYGNPNVPVFAPLDVIADLEALAVGHADHPPVTRLLAQLSGFALAPMTPNSGSPEPNIHILLADLALSAAAAEAAILTALSDGRVTLTEQARAAQLVDDQIASLQHLRAALSGPAPLRCVDSS